MDRDEFIGKIQMVYVGDKNASKDIIAEYDNLQQRVEQLEKERNMYKGSFEEMSKNYFELENIIKEAIESIEDCKKVNDYDNICTIDYNYLLNILNKGSDKSV